MEKPATDFPSSEIGGSPLRPLPLLASSSPLNQGKSSASGSSSVGLVLGSGNLGFQQFGFPKITLEYLSNLS